MQPSLLVASNRRNKRKMLSFPKSQLLEENLAERSEEEVAESQALGRDLVMLVAQLLYFKVLKVLYFLGSTKIR